MNTSLGTFSDAVRGWFLDRFAGPTEVQTRAWETIAIGANALVIAPTGSGKTLAAFLQAIDDLMNEKAATAKWQRGVRVLYVSPLKALGADVERNLAVPLEEIAARVGADVRVEMGMRTGDTSASERARLQRKPPDILITTPESLYLILTSRAREMLRSVRTVIVDEIHSIAGNKRGAHLSLSLERLDDLVGHPVQRVGLSATVEPQEEVARFLGGVQPVSVVAAEGRTDADISVRVPVRDMTAIPAVGDDRASSIWPYLESAILDEVLAHASTIVFVNSRGLCERLTARLNDRYAQRVAGRTDKDAIAEMAGRAVRSDIGSTSALSGAADATIAKAHHGSVSKEQRALVENELKTGTLRCVVATSSLELGIDMGEVDLVIQVAPPPSVASGLQRIGRANHHVAGRSKAIMFPRVRTETIDCAAAVEGMAAGLIESTHLVDRPLDVLAQQTVAAVSLCPDGLSADDWFGVVKRSANFAELSRDAFDAVIGMLSGVFASGDVAEFAPRITVDAGTGMLMPLPRSQRLAVSAGGTIPDRGSYPAMLPEGSAEGGRRRVGELDEEMVHESRVGDRIILGTSTWRIAEIDRDRVIVEPAPGAAARLPFWHGESTGRAYDEALRRGALVRCLAGSSQETVETRLIVDGLDAFARENLKGLLAHQRQATGVVPDDRTVIIEVCADEEGDDRIVIHASFGKRVCEPWALAITARVRERFGFDPQAMAADTGIVVRFPQAESGDLPDLAAFLFDPDEAERIVAAEVGATALFAARFRECASRALLVASRQPGKRAPLWQQRVKGGQLLEAARREGDFPLLAEAARECLHDVYDMGALRQVMEDIDTGAVRVSAVRTQTPSPFAAPLLFGYVADHLYEGDLPHAERRHALLSVDADLLGELLGSDKAAEVLDQAVVDAVQAELQGTAAGYRARGVEGVCELLRRVGPLSTSNVACRTDGPLDAMEDDEAAACADDEQARALLDELEAGHRAFRTQIAGAPVWAVAEDAARLRAVLGAPCPDWARIEGDAGSAETLLDGVIARILRTNALCTAESIAQELGLGTALVEESLRRLAGQGRAVQMAYPADAPIPSWTDPVVMRRLRARSLAAARQAIAPVDQATYLRYLFDLQGIGDAEGVDGIDRLAEIIAQFEGVFLPAQLWEASVFPTRMAGYDPVLLDDLLACGDVVWQGGTDGKGNHVIAFYPSDSPFCPVRIEPCDRTDQGALAEMVWNGCASSDSFAFVRASIAGRLVERIDLTSAMPRRAHSRRAGRRYAASAGAKREARERVIERTARDAAFMGTWWKMETPEVNDTVCAMDIVDSLLDRYGVVTRDIALGAGVPGGLGSLYPVLRSREDAGELLRGAFVEGMGPSQFAAVDTIEHLRSFADAGTGPAIVLDADDPIDLLGRGLPWPASTVNAKPARRAGALVVFWKGMPILHISAHGRDIISFSEDVEALRCAACAFASTSLERARRLHTWSERIQVRTFDGKPVLDTPFATVLEEVGFVRSGLEMRLYLPYG